MTWESMGREVRKVAAGTLHDNRGQGTTEYAILVGVLVVIAIVAILAFRERVSKTRCPCRCGGCLCAGGVRGGAFRPRADGRSVACD